LLQLLRLFLNRLHLSGCDESSVSRTRASGQVRSNFGAVKQPPTPEKHSTGTSSFLAAHYYVLFMILCVDF